MARIHTLNSVSSPDAAPKTFKDRYCPGMRSCWQLNPVKFDPRERSKDDRDRRICMLITLGCHTAHSVLSLLFTVVSLSVVSTLVDTVLALLGFFFLAGCLIAIGDAQGERLVLGRNIGRWHFDVFLIFCACVSGAMLLGTFFGLTGVPGFFLALVPLPMWVLIFGVAWVATWDSAAVSIA